jgi:hypothetical protein
MVSRRAEVSGLSGWTALAHAFSCPNCGSGDCWRTGAGLSMCAECGLKTSATAGTIFHRSHTTLSTWFAAIWFVTSQQNGVSARGLQDALGFGSYETAWACCTGSAAQWCDQNESCSAASSNSTRASWADAATARRAGQPRRRRSRSPSSGSQWPSGLPAARSGRGAQRRGSGRIRLRRQRPGTEIHTDGAWVLARLSDHGFTHRPHPGLPCQRPRRGHARTAPGLLAAQTMDSRHPAPSDQPPTPALLLAGAGHSRRPPAHRPCPVLRRFRQQHRPRS